MPGNIDDVSSPYAPDTAATSAPPDRPQDHKRVPQVAFQQGSYLYSYDIFFLTQAPHFSDRAVLAGLLQSRRDLVKWLVRAKALAAFLAAGEFTGPHRP